MTNKITRDDIRYSPVDDDSTYRAWIGDMNMGYWLGDDIEEFKAAIHDELLYAVRGEEAAMSMDGLVIEECLSTNEYGDPVWTTVFGY